MLIWVKSCGRAAKGRSPSKLALGYPTAVDGLRSVAAVHAAAASASAHGSWVDAVPPSLKP